MSSTRKSASSAGLAGLVNRRNSEGVEEPPAAAESPRPAAPPAQRRPAQRSRRHQVAARLNDDEKRTFDRVLLQCIVELDDTSVSKHDLLSGLIRRYVREDNVEDLCRLIEEQRAGG